MIVSEVIKDGIKVVGLNGRLDISTQDAVQDKINTLLSDGSAKIVIDCSDLTFISSAGLRVFMSALKQVSSVDGKLVISSLNDTTRKIFDITGYDSVFNIATSLDEALKQF